MRKMLTATCLTLLLLGFACIGTSDSKPAAPVDRQALKERISTLLDKANALSDQGLYAQALDHIRQVVDIYQPFGEQLTFKYSVLDFQHFLLLKTGAFQEAVASGLALEALGQAANGRKSPWDCLKIADAYLGLQDEGKALDWIEKAVYERDFNRMDALRNETYAALRDQPRFHKVLADVEKSLGIGQTAKDFIIQLLDHSQFHLADQKGKVVLIDFWDVACPPCRKAMPQLKKLHLDYAGRGLQIIGISLDTDRKLLGDYLQEIAAPYPMACSFKGWCDETAKLYRLNATPTTFLIDRQGILRHINLQEEDLERAIMTLL